MRVLSFAAMAGCAALLSGPLAAQTPEVPQDAAPMAPPAAAAAPATPSRYTFNSVDGGFLRLDSVSGQVALCSQRSAGWACQAVPEDRAALEGEIARLQGEVTQLRTEVAALRPPATDALRPPAELAPRSPDAKGGFKMPSDEDIGWARERVRHVWRQFVDMVAEMQRDMKK